MNSVILKPLVALVVAVIGLLFLTCALLPVFLFRVYVYSEPETDDTGPLR